MVEDGDLVLRGRGQGGLLQPVELGLVLEFVAGIQHEDVDVPVLPVVVEPVQAQFLLVVFFLARIVIAEGAVVGLLSEFLDDVEEVLGLAGAFGTVVVDGSSRMLVTPCSFSNLSWAATRSRALAIALPATEEGLSTSLGMLWAGLTGAAEGAARAGAAAGICGFGCALVRARIP